MSETNKYQASIKQSSEDDFEKTLNDINVSFEKNRNSTNGIAKYDFNLTIE